MLNNNSEQTIFELRNFTVRDSVLTSPRSIVSTLNLENDADFVFILDGFYASNVTFENYGVLLLFAQGLTSPVIVRNSRFSNLQSAMIIMTTSRSLPGLCYEVSFENCTFETIYSLSQPFMRVSKEATATFINSTFHSSSIASDRSGLIEVNENSKGIFKTTNFTNNAAITSTLFSVQSGAYAECHS